MERTKMKRHIHLYRSKRNIKHGEVYFPIQKYITKLTKEAPVITMHWHEEAELTLITKGSCVYQIDLVEYEASTGGYPVYSSPTAAFHYPEKQSGLLFGNLCIPYESFGRKYCRHLFYPLPYAHGKPRIIFTLSHYRGSSCI